MYTKGDLAAGRKNAAKKAREAREAARSAQPPVDAPRAWRSMPSDRQRGYNGLWDLVGSDEFRSLAVRHDGHGGCTFTLKAVLVVRDAPLGVYMHGTITEIAELPSVLEDLLVKGQWREDRYHKK